MLNFSITDHDLDRVESVMDGIRFDEKRREIIKRLDSFDVQAFPGTGKTTVIIGKLMALLDKWDSSTSGICVISHTNVAKEEIEHRISKDSKGKNLQMYPHFVGTLNSFFDTYVAIPWLRSHGYPVVTVDTEIALRRRFASLNYGSKTYLSKRAMDENACEAIDYPIKLKNLGCREDALTFKDVKRVIELSYSKGFFTYDEMLYIARYALRENPSLAATIQERFPIVMVDEAQDTSDLQWELLEIAFPKNGQSIIQLFGDVNQAIYQSYMNSSSSTRYPQEPILTIPDSKRFGKSISTLSNRLSISKEAMEGKSDFFEHITDKNTVFLFDKEKIDQVVPAFSSYVLECFTDEELEQYKGDGIHIVGMVHNKEALDASDKQFPASITDYWNQYQPRLSGINKKPDALIDYFRLANKEEEFTEKVEVILQGIKKLLNKKLPNGLPQRASALNALLDQIPLEDTVKFKSELMSIVEAKADTIEGWRQCESMLHSFTKSWYGVDFSSSDDFMKWKELSIDKNGNAANRFVFKNGENRSVEIEFSSIHAVKGRTHLATLVVDTYWYNRNIPSILPWITGTSGKKKIAERNAMRLKCHYVGLTRARGLVCMAIPKGSLINKDIENLSDAGWNIVEI